jgi:hypothetical protein
MDGLSFHPYPNSATDPLERGYAWPNAGFVNLDRVKQAVWDAFAGTGQPTTVEGLRLYLDEVGWQVDTSGRLGYVGAENVAVTDEASQAAVYGALVRRAGCDPDVAQVNVFGFRDDALRTGFQAGLFRVDGTARPSADSVRDAAAEPGCATEAGKAWRPARTVLGAKRPVVPAGRSAHALERNPGARGPQPTRRLHDGVRRRESMGLGPSPARGRASHGRRPARRRDQSRAVDHGRPGGPVAAGGWTQNEAVLALDSEHVFCHTTNTCSFDRTSAASCCWHSPSFSSGRSSRGSPAPAAPSRATA